MDSNLVEVATSNDDSKGYAAWGIPYLPSVPSKMDYCLQDVFVPESVPKVEDIPSRATPIAIAPYKSVECANAIVDQAMADKARMLILVSDDPQITGNTIFPSGNYPITILGLSSQTGKSVFANMGLYTSNETVAIPGTNIGNTIRRIGLQVQSDSEVGLPKLWVFVLVILAALLLIIVTASVILNVVQLMRRRNLRSRIMRGEVDLERLGFKNLTVPKSVLEKIPICTYKHGEQHFSQKPIHFKQEKRSFSTKVSESLKNCSYKLFRFSKPVDSASNNSEKYDPTHTGFSQTSCSICLEEFQPGITLVRNLPCGHIYHTECIDSFLTSQSSLCPLCKSSVLPPGYIPPTFRLTNTLVRRERNLRRREAAATNPDSLQYNGPLNLLLKPIFTIIRLVQRTTSQASAAEQEQRGLPTHHPRTTENVLEDSAHLPDLQNHRNRPRTHHTNNVYPSNVAGNNSSRTLLGQQHHLTPETEPGSELQDIQQLDQEEAARPKSFKRIMQSIFPI